MQDRRSPAFGTLSHPDSAGTQRPGAPAPSLVWRHSLWATLSPGAPCPSPRSDQRRAVRTRRRLLRGCFNDRSNLAASARTRAPADCGSVQASRGPTWRVVMTFAWPECQAARLPRVCHTSAHACERMETSETTSRGASSTIRRGSRFPGASSASTPAASIIFESGRPGLLVGSSSFRRAIPPELRQMAEGARFESGQAVASDGRGWARARRSNLAQRLQRAGTCTTGLRITPCPI